MLNNLRSTTKRSVLRSTASIGIEILFKQNKLDYIKRTASFVSSNTVFVQLNNGGESTVKAKNTIIAIESEISTGALSLQEVPEKMVVIGGGIIGLEMGSVWGRLGTEVTVVEFLSSIGGTGIDKEISKQSQKSLTKQGLKFKLSTKVLSAEKEDGKVAFTTEAAKGGKQDLLEAHVVLVAVGRWSYLQGIGLNNGRSS
ncbi:hypothetical protein H4582DRAFT_2091365 [Lactarius indigo]|nr:hypothetical protein H4582DRAFT_2091365 [Lactarius indigo]